MVIQAEGRLLPSGWIPVMRAAGGGGEELLLPVEQVDSGEQPLLLRGEQSSVGFCWGFLVGADGVAVVPSLRTDVR